jgi:hypothetical protein
MPAVYLYNFEEIKQFQVSHNVAYHWVIFTIG